MARDRAKIRHEIAMRFDCIINDEPKLETRMSNYSSIISLI